VPQLSEGLTLGQEFMIETISLRLTAMQITLDLPDDLASQLGAVQNKLPEILKLGLRELNASPREGFSGIADILEFLADLPTPEEILALRPTTELQTQISELLDKNRSNGLNAEEEQLWQSYEYLEHIVRMAKAKAHTKLWTSVS
jgi:hypothetical protein